jgi:hypothetical protein
VSLWAWELLRGAGSLQGILWPIDKLFGQERLVKVVGSLRKLIASPLLEMQDEEAFRIVEPVTG